jgi:hypothetical protein
LGRNSSSTAYQLCDHGWECWCLSFLFCVVGVIKSSYFTGLWLDLAKLTQQSPHQKSVFSSEKENTF